MTDIPPDEARDADYLLTEFFAALAVRDLERCAQIQAITSARPGGRQWGRYLTGVLANERDHNWARAEAILSDLLADEVAPPLRGRALLALGRTYDYQGRWEEAIATYERCLPVFAALGQPIDRAKVWKQIAIAYRNGFAQGDFGPAELARAEEYCRQALAALDGLPDAASDLRWLVGSIWNTLGAIKMNQGRWDAAAECYQRDMAICRALDDRHGVGVSLLNLGEIAHRRGPGSWDAAAACYREALALLREFVNRHLEADALANLAALAHERGDGAGAMACYAEAIDIVESLRAGVSSGEARAGFATTVADIYANAVICCVECGRPDLAFAYVERARARAFLDSLGAGAEDLAEPAPLGLAEVQAALADGELLLAYFTTGLVEAGASREHGLPAQRHRFPPERTLLFAVAHDGLEIFQLSISPSALQPPLLNSVVEDYFLRPATRRALYDLLLAPAAGSLAGRRRVYLVPHGPLHYIPFQALIAADGDTLLRPGAPALAYGPSASVLLRRAARPDDPPSLPMLAVGANGAGASQLRFAEQEARSLAELLGGRAITGPSLSLSALIAAAPVSHFLHISCHGIFLPEAPLDSALILGPQQRLTARDILGGPRLRCALVSLSACESGLSRVRRGDELVGLTRAFLEAGAAAVLCTLWRVDERSTRILMEQFYRHILAGARPAAALQRAQIDLRTLTRYAARKLLVGDLTRELAVGMESFLKGEAADDQDFVSLTDGPDDEPPFAEPRHWAPFILVGLRDAL